MASLHPDYFRYNHLQYEDTKNKIRYEYPDNNGKRKPICEGCMTEDQFDPFWEELNSLEGRMIQSECRANITKMKYKPIRLTFPHEDKQTALRKLLWHEDDLVSNVS